MNRGNIFVSIPVFAGLLVTATAAGQAPATTPAPAAAQAQQAPPTPPEVEIGQLAPDFTLPIVDATGQREKPFKLSDYRGKLVVLAFYPRDKSSGCTAQLTKFRDEYERIFGSETVLVPISVDSIGMHASWSAEMKFPFALASDPGMSVAKMYGSQNAERGTANRTMFLIGRDGRIVWRNMRFLALNESHYTELAEAVAQAR